MQIKKISDSDLPAYDEIAQKYGTVFNTIRWLKMFGGDVQLYGIYDNGKSMFGGFTIYVEKKFGLQIFRNPPYTPVMGPFLKIDTKNNVKIMKTWKSVLSSMADFIESQNFSITTFSLSRGIIDTQPFIWKKFMVHPAYTYVVDLMESLDKIEKNLSKSHRKDINKTAKDGLMTKQIDDMTIVKDLVLKTFSRQEKKADEVFLDKILFEFSTPDNSCAFATYKDSLPISTTFFVHDNSTAYALLGGYDHDNKHIGAGVATRWEAIKHAKKIGLQYFDFEGSMIPRIEKFYRGYGGRLTPYYRVNKAKLPLEILLKFYKRGMF